MKCMYAWDMAAVLTIYIQETLSFTYIAKGNNLNKLRHHKSSVQLCGYTVDIPKGLQTADN